MVLALCFSEPIIPIWSRGKHVWNPSRPIGKISSYRSLRGHTIKPIENHRDVGTVEPVMLLSQGEAKHELNTHYPQTKVNRSCSLEPRTY